MDWERPQRSLFSKFLPYVDLTLVDTMKNRLHMLTRLHGVALFEANEAARTYSKHAHSGFAIGAITGGVGGYWCRGAHHVLPRRTLTLMNPEEPHTGYAVDNVLHYKMLYVPEEAVRELLETGPLQGFPEINPADRNEEIARDLVALSELLDGRCARPAAALRIDEILSSVLARVFGRHGGQRLRPAGSEPLAVRRAADRIDAHIEAALAVGADAPLTIAELAAEVGLNPNYLIQSFTAARGISPHAYLLFRKICRAKELIVCGMAPLEAALMLGFYDQSHFIRTFRRVLGVTPGALVIH